MMTKKMKYRKKSREEEKNRLARNISSGHEVRKEKQNIEDLDRK